MDFKPQPNPTFKTKVTIRAPGEKPQILSCTFRHKRKKEYTDWIDRAKTSGNDAESLLEVLAGWDYPPGDPSIETINELLESYPSSGGALFLAYTQELFGVERKN